MLLSLALRRGQAKWTARQEAALRRRLGGEMVLEELLLCPEAQAHLTCALLLCRRWALAVEDIIPGGVICRQEGEKLLISCLRLAPEESLTAGALLPFARAVREAEAVRLRSDRAVRVPADRDHRDRRADLRILPSEGNTV